MKSYNHDLLEIYSFSKNKYFSVSKSHRLFVFIFSLALSVNCNYLIHFYLTTSVLMRCSGSVQYNIMGGKGDIVAMA